MGKKLTLKMQTALMDYVQNPNLPIKTISERNGVKYDSLRVAIKNHQDWINEKSMEIWRERKIMAMRTMEKLAERGNFKALDFVLRSNGIVPEERITTDNQEIHITLENKDEK